MTNLIRKYNLSWRSVFFDADPTVPPFQVLVTAVWFGLLCGFFEVSLLFTRPGLPQTDFIWMPVVSDSVLFTLIGLPLFGAARLWPKVFSPRRMIFIIAFLGFVHLELISHKVHIYAWRIIAAGLAFQTTSIIIKKSFMRLLIRRSVIAMAILAIGLTTVVNVLKFNEERDALAKLPDAPANAPNVLLIVLDTVRAKSLGLYGYERSTSPQLERLAKEGVTFERAWSPAPWTLPAHASMFTGRSPFELSTNWQTPLDDTNPTLAEILREHGYLTAGFVANLTYCAAQFGIDRGFIHYEDLPKSLGMFVSKSYLGESIFKMIKNMFAIQRRLVYKDATLVGKTFFHWLSGKKDSRPFFAFLNYFDAHTPYFSPKPFNVMFGTKKPIASLLAKNTPWWHFTMDQRQVILNAYEGAISYVDHELGLLFDELEKQGVLENTMVIITSDHGELFGEHDLFGHGNSLYRSVLHVPLVISFPSRVPANTRVQNRVSLCDIPATVLDLLNLEQSPPFPGNSLARYWVEGDKQKTQETVLASQLHRGINLPKKVKKINRNGEGDMASIILGDLHYIRNGNGSQELYNLNIDLDEEHNLVEIRKYERELQKCRAAIDSILMADSVSTDVAFKTTR